MSFIARMFCEANGSPSSVRAMTCLVVVCIMGTWVLMSIRLNAIQPMSTEHVGMVVGALGLKVWQRGKEGGAGNGDTQVFTKTPGPGN